MYQAYEVTYVPMSPQVFVEGADGATYYARLVNYDSATNAATFQMLDGLPNGSYTLHLSGSGGLIDLGGNPLVGNDPSGDYVIPFSVAGPDYGISGDMANGYWMISQAGQGVPQQLGVLFPDELQAGLSILRYPESGADPGASSTQDTYVFQVLQQQQYTFELIGDDLPAGTQLTMTDAAGQAIDPSTFGGQLYFAILQPGTYTVSVGGWTGDQSAGVSYQLLIDLDGGQDNAPPLADGPAPALEIALAAATALPGAPTAGGPISSGGAGTGVSGIVEPIDTSSAGGGGSGAVGSTVGSSPVSASGAVASDLAQNEAVGGLAGLAMGPLGGLGGQTGPLPSATIQVALSVPSTAGPASNSLALSLVTLTQMISWDREGDGSEPAETPDPPGDVASDPPIPLTTASIVAEVGPPTGRAGMHRTAIRRRR